MEASSNRIPSGTRKRNDKGRKSWSLCEEEVLLAGLKEIVANGWKSENGFKVGYLQALEQYMSKALPGTYLKAIPHINSNIHIWKKNYMSLFSMSSRTGIGYNESTKMIESTNKARDSYVKVDGNAKLMRYKSWPFYTDWCEIFGKDRATGGHAECLDPIYEVLGSFCQNTNARLGDIAKKIGYEFDISNARKEVFAVVENMTDLTLHEKLLVSTLLVKDTEDLELFFSLPDDAKVEFAKMKLADNL